MSRIILFDVDGTLAKPMQLVEQKMVDKLISLKKIKDLDIAIVGGSNLEKQKKQLGEHLNLFDYIFSENGLVSFKKNELMHQNSISKELGEENIKKLINTSLEYLSGIDIPIKRGNFIEFRNGMINISPVGRSCSQEEREQFDEFDKLHCIRKKMVEFLKVKLVDLNLQFSIGGQISIDVFPQGWDKTYCLQFVKDKYKKIYFFGDKTMEGGNDYEIYNHKLTEGFTVKSPEDTILILNMLGFTPNEN